MPVTGFLPPAPTSYSLRETYLRDINEQSLAVGTTVKAFQVPGGTLITYTGFYWSPNTDKVAIDLIGPQSVNDAGLIGGSYQTYSVGAGQLTTMPIPPGYHGPLQVFGINNAGIGVGYVQTCSCSNSQGTQQVPYVWDAVLGGRVITDVPDAKDFVRVNNSSVAVGNIKNASLGRDAVIYNLETGQHTLLGSIDPPPGSTAVWTTAADISDTGLVAGQRMLTYAGPKTGYLWSASTGFTYLEAPPGYQPDVKPTGVNSTGTLVGEIYDASGSARAFVWDAQHGVRDLNTVAANIPSGFVLTSATKINDHGWIVGYGQGGGGFSKAFVLKPLDTCLADCNADGLLTVADFGCFQTRFVAADPYADCNADGALSVADFGCFQTSFALGCP